MTTATVHQRVAVLAPDLTHQFPRSPRIKLAGYVVGARTLDKCRSKIAGTLGEYDFDCPLDQLFFGFTGIDAGDFEAAVADGRTDGEMEEWIKEHARDHSEEQVIQWNNDLRYKRISEMEPGLQVFLEGYIDEVIPKDRVIHHWFDVYDIEEGRL